MKKYIVLFIKGIGMGAANVVPGVSGGTIALITGIFEKLIRSIKSFDVTALKLFFSGKFRQFALHVNLGFLIAVFAGIFFSIVSVARLFGFLFDNYPVYIWSFFFGLILASVYYVGKTIGKWNLPVIISLVVGATAALLISFLTPASENSSLLYLFVCGIVATCSMILPGLSGSFVLILMGNYRLVMIDSVNNLDVAILLPVIAGAVLGLIAFSHLLTWVFNKFKNQTIGLLTGFIVGSLGLLWPWKESVYATNPAGELLLKENKPIVEGYKWLFPAEFSQEVILAFVFIIAGIAVIWGIETLAKASPMPRRHAGSPSQLAGGESRAKHQETFNP